MTTHYNHGRIFPEAPRQFSNEHGDPSSPHHFHQYSSSSSTQQQQQQLKTSNNSHEHHHSSSSLFRSEILVILLRGPLIMVGAIIAYGWPYRQELWTIVIVDRIHLWKCLGIMMVGCFVFGWDLWSRMKGGVRYYMKQLVHCVSVDDILHAIYNPTTGLLPTTIGTFVGASTMYTIGMNDHQRIQVIQSAFGFPNEVEARTFLLEKGGYVKLLFPNCVQQWLLDEVDDGRDDDHAPIALGSQSARLSQGGVVVHEEDYEDNYRQPLDVSATDSSSDDIIRATYNCSGVGTLGSSDTDSIQCDDISDGIDYDDNNNNNTDDVDIRHPLPTQTNNSPRSNQNNDHEVRPPQQHHQQQQLSPPRDPIITFMTILRDMALQRLQPTMERHLPTQQTIENVGTAAIVGLGLQFILRRGARRHKVLGTICAILMSTIASCSVGSILIKEVTMGRIYDKSSLQLVCHQMGSRIWKNIRLNVLANKTKSALAFMVLYFVGRQKKQL